MNDSPDYKTPGQLIHDLLTQRTWTQRVLAIVLGSDETGINKIIGGKRPVDADMALRLSDIFGVPAERFLELQKQYDLAQARLIARPDPKMAQRARLFGDLPVSDMIKRGWLDAEDIRNVPKVETALAKFFGTDSTDEIEILPHSAKKTSVSSDVTPVQLAWLYRVKQIASELLVCKYSPALAQRAVNELHNLLGSAQSIRKIPRIMAESGIRFVIVEGLPSSKIDGVCFWLDEHSPVIGMSLRYDRIDNFWFVLRHEFEHVLRNHGQSQAMLDADLEGERAGGGSEVPEEERIANEAAAEFCVPKKSMDSFIARKSPIFAERDIIGFSRTLHIHPGLVAGQLQRRTGKYELFRKHLVKVRSIVSPGAAVDGWGDVAPVEQ